MSLSDKEYLQINQALFSLAHAYEARMAENERLHPTGLALSDRAVLMVLGKHLRNSWRLKRNDLDNTCVILD